MCGFRSRHRDMCYMGGARGRCGPLDDPHAFSLTELLVVMAIIAVVGTLTAISLRGIAQDARLSSAENTVTAALGSARALAMKDNTLVAVVFRARWDPTRPSKRQFTEVYTARWTGDSYQPFMEEGAWSHVTPDFIRDRFEPYPGVGIRPLPPGIKVAGPFYELNEDTVWLTQPELAFTNPSATSPEWSGEIIGVLFGPRGTVLTRNPAHNTNRYSAYLELSNSDLDGDLDLQDIGSTSHSARYYTHDEADDETNIAFVPFLSVYDDDAAREVKTIAWNTEANYRAELTGPNGYIARLGRPIYFNRFTGVVMSEPDR